MKIKFLPDKPLSNSLEDLLGFNEFIDLILESIYFTTPPFVYGVLGDWGTGKTSILNLLANKLDYSFNNHSQSFVPIWFNAWHYENETNMIYPLLNAIKKDYDTRVGVIDEAKSFASKFLKVVATSTLALTDLGLRALTNHITGESLKLEDISKQIKEIEEKSDQVNRVLSSWVDSVRELNNAFDELLSTYTNELSIKHQNLDKNSVKFVIIIDDLDRCLPETTISLLESIKNHLSTEKCIFIFGLNPNVVYQGIKIKYKGLNVNGREYLEKIINYSFYVPEPKIERIKEFATKKITERIFENSDKERYKTILEEFGNTLDQCKFNNPRKITRIVNRYLLFINKNEAEINKYNTSNVVKLIVLAEYFPTIFNLLLKNIHENRAVLAKIGESDFNVEGMEKQFGISLSEIYPHLSRMKNLVKLVSPVDRQLPDLNAQVQAVFDITRFI